MADPKARRTQPTDFDETTARASLPHLDIEIVHRRAHEGNAEQLSVTLQAVPSLEAFGRFLESTSPLRVWLSFAEAAWLPWLKLLDVAYPLAASSRPPRISARPDNTRNR